MGFELLVYVFIGAVLFRVIDFPEDFYVMGRSAGGILVAGTLFASYMSASAMMGIIGIVYIDVDVMWLVIYGSWPWLVLGILYIDRRFRAQDELMMPDYIGDRCQSEFIRLVATVIMMIDRGSTLGPSRLATTSRSSPERRSQRCWARSTSRSCSSA